MVEIIRPADRAAWLAARGRDVTASQIGALFGEHEYMTPFSLWGLKTGRIPREEEETPAMQRGRLLEPVAVQMLRERFPSWKIEHNAAENVYFRDPAARMGATPDVIAMAKDRGGKGVVQIKSVEASIFKRKWLDQDGEVEPPLWIALQASLEAHLTGARWAAVAPLVVGHGLDMPLIDIPLVEGVVDAMKAKVAEFWTMIEEGREPSPDFGRDADAIEAIYHADEEAEADLTGDNRIMAMLAERAFAKEAIGKYGKLLDALDAEIKSKLGNATVAHLPGGRKITWRSSKREGFFVGPKTVRVLKVPAVRE